MDSANGHSFINKYDLDWKLVAQQEVGQATHSPLFGDPELEQYIAHLGPIAINPADGHIYFTVTETVKGEISNRSGLVKVNPDGSYAELDFLSTIHGLDEEG